MEPVDDGRKLQEADALETSEGTFIVTAVSYQDGPDGEHINFTYQIKDPADIVAPEVEEAE
jgi:hypothetical protein